jgi:hypothetical protein
MPCTGAQKASDLQLYKEKLLEIEETGWAQTTLQIKHWPDPVVLRHRDGVEWLREVCAHPDLLKAVQWDGKAIFKNGRRVYSAPVNCDAFLSEQAEVRKQHGSSSKVAALQVSRSH